MTSDRNDGSKVQFFKVVDMNGKGSSYDLVYRIKTEKISCFWLRPGAMQFIKQKLLSTVFRWKQRFIYNWKKFNCTGAPYQTQKINVTGKNALKKGSVTTKLDDIEYK